MIAFLLVLTAIALLLRVVCPILKHLGIRLVDRRFPPPPPSGWPPPKPPD